MGDIEADETFEAVKIAWSQDKNGYILKLSIHPDDIPKNLSLDPLGTTYMVGTRKLQDGFSPSNSLSKGIKIAGMLCRDNNFLEYLGSKGSIRACGTEDDAAAFLHSVLGVDSRREISAGSEAEKKVMEIASEFREWAKRQQGTTLPRRGGDELDNF